MQVRTFALSIAFVIALGGCATQAVIADLESDKVIVRATGDDASVIWGEARRGCGMHNKSPQEVSYRCLDTYCFTRDILFACN